MTQNFTPSLEGTVAKSLEADQGPADDLLEPGDASGLPVAPGAVEQPEEWLNPDLVERARQFLARACAREGERYYDEQGRGLLVEFAVSQIVVPSPNEGRPMPMLAITLSIPSLDPTRRVHSTTLTQNLWADQVIYDHLVGESVPQLLEALAGLPSEDGDEG